MLRHISILFSIWLFSLHYFNSMAQVKVTAPAKLKVGTGSLCTPASLDPIIIKETSNGDFVDNTSLVTYTITLPDGFEFANADENSISIDYSGTGGASGYTAGLKNLSDNLDGYSNRLTFSYTLTGSADIGTITISGIKISCYQPGAKGFIYRTGGSAEQTGNEPNVQKHGELDSGISNLTARVSELKYTTYYEAPNGSYSSIYGSYAYTNFPTSSPSVPTNFCNKNSYIYAIVNPGSGGTLSLWDGNTEITQNGYTTTNYSYGYFYPTINDVGNKDYNVKFTYNNCVFQEKISVTWKKVPKEYDLVSGVDTTYEQGDDPVALNDFLVNNTGENSKLEWISGRGVSSINNQSTFLFVPGVFKSGSMIPYYTVLDNNNGCKGYYGFKKPLIVADPMAPLPNYVVTSKNPPYCINGGAPFTIKFVAPAGLGPDSIMYAFSINKKSGYVSGYDYLNGITESPTYTIDPVKDNPGNGLISFSVSFMNKVNNTYMSYPGVIALFPERNPKYNGLPDPSIPGDSIVELCYSSKDTINLRPTPANGKFDIYKYNPLTGNYSAYTTTTVLKTKSGPGTSSTDRVFIPEELFSHADGANGDDQVKFKMRYIYPGSNFGQCPDTTTRIIKFGTPLAINHTIVAPTTNPVCFGDTLVSRIDYGTVPYSEEDRFNWIYGDGLISDSDSLLIMRHIYKQPGLYYLRFKTKVKNMPPGYCNNDQIDTIRIGAKPMADFDVVDNYLDKTAKFTSLSKLNSINITDKSDTIKTWSWDFGTDNTISYVNETDRITQNTYTALSREPYPIIHKVRSGWGCVDSIIKPTPIFRIIQPKMETTYSEDFNDVNEATSWYESGSYKRDTLKSSWVNNTPVGITINGKNPAWSTLSDTTDNSSTRDSAFIARYKNEEISWVESPVFNLDSLTMPMISMDTWVNADNSFDGVCLQYAICDNIAFGREKWKMVGEYGKGVNWYNSYTVISRPTEWNMDGWSGTDAKDWSFSANDLDAVLKDVKIKGAKLIRFRVLFTSNKDNFPNKNLDGFAFDNFFLGQRNRKVVIEEFCDYKNYDDGDLATLEPAKFNENQAIKIQYHTALFNNDDQINMSNPDEPGARALLYGIGKKLPRGVIDGIYYNNNDSVSKWGVKRFEARSLMISPFAVSVKAERIKSSGNDSLKVTAKIVKINAAELPKNYVVQLAVVESEVSGNGRTFGNVLRNLLPNAAGNRIDKSLSWTDISVARSWRPFAEPQSDFKIIAFIQDEDTKEIYQADQVIVPLDTILAIKNSKSGGITEENISFNEMYIQPNPVAQDLKVFFNGILNDKYKWVITDSYGRPLMSGNLSSGMNAAIINTQQLPSGIYHLQMEGEGRVMMEKFAVVK